MTIDELMTVATTYMVWADKRLMEETYRQVGRERVLVIPRGA